MSHLYVLWLPLKAHCSIVSAAVVCCSCGCCLLCLATAVWPEGGVLGGTVSRPGQSAFSSSALSTTRSPREEQSRDNI